MATSTAFEIPQAFAVRKGEKPRTWYRGERIFRCNDGWYVHTRESIDIGPYACRFDAQVDLELLVRLLKTCDAEQARRIVFSQAVSAVNREHQLTTAPYVSYLVEEGGVELLDGKD